MWAASPLLNEAIGLGECWGFRWMTVAYVWDKEVVSPGYYTMPQCELCLVFKFNRIPQPRGSRNERQLVVEKRTTHSSKPKQVRDSITAMFPTQNKIELFAREKYEDWDSWGLEV